MLFYNDRMNNYNFFVTSIQKSDQNCKIGRVSNKKTIQRTNKL